MQTLLCGAWFVFKNWTLQRGSNPGVPDRVTTKKFPIFMFVAPVKKGKQSAEGKFEKKDRKRTIWRTNGWTNDASSDRELALAGNTGNKHALPKLPALPGQGRSKVLGRSYFVRKKCIPGADPIKLFFLRFPIFAVLFERFLTYRKNHCLQNDLA